MNISMENLDKVSAVLTLTMEKADYEERVNKSLRSLRQKANIHGFRPGQVPMSIIQRRFGKDVLAEEVNKILGEKLYGYIKENNVNMLGEPLPDTERQKPVNFDTDETFSFVFDIALAPAIDATITAADKVGIYEISVTDKMIDGQVQMYAQRAGHYDKVDSYQEKDMLKGLLAELDEQGNTKEGGKQVEGAVMMPDYIKNAEQKALFGGCKVNDVLVFNPSKAYEGNDTEISTLLKIKKDEVANFKGDFSYQIQEITRFVPAEVNQELFDQIYGKDNVKSVEEFRAHVKDELSRQFVADEDYKFMQDVRAAIMAKNKDLQYPETLLKRLMKDNNPDKDEKFIDENYPKSIDELTWQLVKEQLVKAHGIKVEDDDVKAMAREATRAQFAQYGMANIPDEVLDKYAAESLKKKEQVDGLVSRCVEVKLAAALKESLKPAKKEITVEEFQKLLA
jgi:trigger factor